MTMFNIGISENYAPTYEEIERDYKNGAISKEQLKDLAQKRHNYNVQQANTQQLKETLGGGVRAIIGGGLEGASFHPIFNIPYVGTGIGGAMFEWGNSINNQESAKDTLKNIGKGFAIGETVGAIPYVGKGLNRLSGGKIGSGLSNIGSKISKSPVGEKASDFGNKLADYLTTDIKAFNPSKQIVYHGSPYDFDKFSNEAIGTGEGAQAHGLGHYAALDKNIADKRYRQALTGDNFDNEQFFYNGKSIDDKNKKAILSTIYENGRDKVLQVREKNIDKYKYNNDEYLQKLQELEWIKSLNENLIKKETNKGQLYKLKVPNDNVMLRENVSFTEQPQAVQKGLRDIQNDILQSKGYNSIDEINSKIDALNAEYETLSNKPVLPWESSPTSQVQAQISDLERLRDMYDFGGSSKNIYRQLNNYYGDKTNELLISKGIKGISYNGGIDGEARVIFNPEDIDIVKKYYNQPDLWKYLNGLKPNEGAELTAIENFLRNPQFPMTEKDFNNYEKLGLNYYQNILQPNSIEVPEYGTIRFNRKNKGKDDITNFKMYPDLFELLKGSKKINRTNYKNEIDREYDYLENPRNKLYQFLIEDIKDKGKRYKMMKNKETGK